MNPANFPQAMMAGQGMPQGGNVSNQLRAMLYTKFQAQQHTSGWQSTLPPGERVNLVHQVTTSLNLAQPNMGYENALKGALALEAEKFNRSGSKEQYHNSMRQQMQVLQQKRAQQAQNVNMGNMGQMVNMGHMGNPQANMQNMMGQPMQATMSNQGNPMATQFNPQLARPMQVSQLPMNAQNPQGMQNGVANGQNQVNPQNPQQQPNNGFSMNENQKINQLALRMMQNAKEEDKAAIMRKFSTLAPQQQAQLRQRFGDPLMSHYRNVAQQLWMRQIAGARQGQNPQQQNGMQNNMMGQTTPMMQRGQPQGQMGQQDNALDFSHLMQQQSDAMRSADSGQLVVPASNNAAMNQNLNGMPMGMATGQMPNNMNNPNVMQNLMQQRQGGMTPQQQAAARLQAQMRSQGQNGQVSQPGQMTPQMKMGGNGQSPMPQVSQPGLQQGQRQPGTTPQQQRPTPAVTPQMQPQQPGQLNPQLLQAMQQAAMAQNSGQPQPIRRPLPPDLPPNTQQSLRHFLQTCSDEHYNVAIEHLRKSQMGAPQMNNVMNNPLMRNNGMQQNPMMANGQNAQQMNLIQQRMAAQQRVNQAQALAQAQGRQPGQIPPGLNISPELMQQMDQAVFPRTILPANNATMVPDHVITFVQLKEWVMNNQAMAGALTVPRIIGFQLELWKRRTQMNGNNPQMNGQMNNGQGAAPGPAPTAPMIPPGGMNNMGQQQPGQPPNMMNAQIAQQMQSIQVTPQEVAAARQRQMFPPQVSDDEIRSKILNLKRQAMMQKIQHQHRAMVQQQQNNANQMGNQRMPQNQMPQPPQRIAMPGQQTPQMGMATPGNNQQNKQPAQRSNQPQPASMKTPQQPANKNLKRPAPDEVIEIADNNNSAPQAPPIQASKSQQGRSNQAGAAADGQTQALLQRFGAILTEVKTKHQPRQVPPLNDAERQQLVAKVNELKNIIMRTEWAIRLFFQGTRDEDKTKMFLARYWHMADTVNPKEGTVLGQPTLRAAEFESLIQPVKQLVVGMMQSKMQNMDNSKSQQPASQANAQAQQTASQQLNAANLEQHTRQQAAAQGHRRSSSKAQVPQAPTAGPGQNPFNFNTASPQGVPKYGEGATTLTADKLTLPRKKQRKDGQPPSGQSTPAQTGMGASPQIGNKQSPQLKKSGSEPSQMPQPPKNPCQDPTCEYNRQGFKTAEELAAHMRQVHAPPADPLKFAMETLATTMGLNADGTAKAEPDTKAAQAPATKTAPQVKAAATPPAGATPLNKIPMKGSPAMDRLKTPQQSAKPAAPTSAVVPAIEKPNDASAKPDATAAVQQMELFDPWKDSALAPNDLLEWLKPYDTFTGDWGNDRDLRSPQLTPATTPDTDVTDKTVSTRDSEVLEGDGLNMTLALNSLDNLASDFMPWKEVEGWEPNIVDLDLMNDFAGVGIEEGLVLGLDNKAPTDINDWEALFGAEANADPNTLPGWEPPAADMVF